MSKQKLVIKWNSAAADSSGYASASRNYLRSLIVNKVDVELDLTSFEPWNQVSNRHNMDRDLYNLVGIKSSSRINVTHHTADLFVRYFIPNKYNIGLFAWEASLLPPRWVPIINTRTDEVWVPSEYNRTVCINSGVTKPVYVIPHAIPISNKSKIKDNIYCAGIREQDFTFYSIFQFSERKNPDTLIRSYCEEFSKYDDVTLLIKCYRRDASTQEKNLVRSFISRIKKQTKGSDSPRILLIEDILSNDDLNVIHNQCDCYISLARAEGFGLPVFEAMAFGNPVICPNYSSFKDYLNNDVAYLVKTENEIPVSGMQHISVLYSSNMKWGDPDKEHCKKIMRYVYENRDEAQDKGNRARAFIENNFNYFKIGQLMRQRIEENYL